MSATEKKTVDMLFSEHGAGSITREEPGEEGALLVEIDRQVWRVDSEGKRRKVS